MKYYLAELGCYLVCILVGFAFVAVVLMLWGCRAHTELSDVRNDSTAQIHVERVTGTHVTSTASDITHWGDHIKTIVLSEKGDTVKYIEKVYIKDTSNKNSADSSFTTNLRIDTVTKIQNHTTTKTVEKELTWWQGLKIQIFDYILVGLLICIISLTIFTALYLKAKRNTKL